MPDLREVFEMVKQQAEPDQDSWSEQERRIRQSQRKRKYGAIALVAALVVVIAVVVASNLDADDQGVAPASVGPKSVPPGPAGSELAFVDLASGATTGTGVVPGGSEVDVSPDGTRMTFVDQSGAVAVANADGSNVQPFASTISAEDASAPRWSPDGTRIVYQREGPAQRLGNLFVLDVTSGQVKQITNLPPVKASLYYMAPTFSADGGSVLFTMPHVVLYPGFTGRQPEWGLYTVPASGGKPTLVRENAGAVDVEPGGDSIAFVRIQEVDGQPRFGALYVARSDGSGAHKLVDGAFLLPRWSPDGSEIAYTDAAHPGMFVVNVATGHTRQVYGSDEWPEWVDQQTLIIDLSD
jgi:Tol biopolymer transport system component